MSRIGLAIRELHRAERDLLGEIIQVGDRNAADHEIFHVARDIAAWSRDHLRELAVAGEAYDVRLEHEPAHDLPLISPLRRRASELLGRWHEPSLLLLHDLRAVHRKAAGVSLDWEILAQTAQALQDGKLLDLCQHCHPQTLRQMKWANAKLKEVAAQAMVT